MSDKTAAEGSAASFQRCPKCGQKDPSSFKPLHEVGSEVYIENKPGVCRVIAVEQTMPGVFRYTISRTETFTAPEQYLTKKSQP